jgi:hypothetical protein
MNACHLKIERHTSFRGYKSPRLPKVRLCLTRSPQTVLTFPTGHNRVPLIYKRLSPRDLAIYLLHSVEVGISISTYKSKQAVTVAFEDAGKASCLDYLVYMKETGMYTGLSSGLRLLPT